MEMVNIELSDQPVVISDYTTYDIKELPKVILGFQIKNKFDEVRLHFKPEYKAKRIMHFCQSTEIEPVFFYGLEIEFDDQYKELLHTLDTFTSIFMQYHKTGKSFVEQYQNHLKQFQVSCNECYRYLCDGVYPIDLIHLSKLIKNSKNLPVDNLAIMLEISKEQWYLNIGAFGIYVLGTCGSYYCKN